MADRELLELAAKAAGYDTMHPWNAERLQLETPQIGLFVSNVSTCWNPLTDDGDALRLVVKLGIDLRIPSSPNQVFVQVGERGSVPFVLERIAGDPLSATRRAIGRAAAEIGGA